MSPRPRALKIALVAVIAVAAAVAAAAGGGALWLHDRLQTSDYCATCHRMTPYFDSWKASDLTAHAHSNAGVECRDCHSRTTSDGLRELALNALPGDARPIRDHFATAGECLRCHGTHEALASRTNALIGPDGFMLGRNPHDSHWGPLDCGVCHNMHKPSVDFCAKCHGSAAAGPAWGRSR